MPSLVDTSFNEFSGQTYQTRNGVYRKIGDLVLFHGRVATIRTGALKDGEALFISGLPFPVANAVTHVPVEISKGVSLNLPKGVALAGSALAGTRRFSLEVWGDNALISRGLVLSEWTSNGGISFSGHYIAASNVPPEDSV